MAYDKAHPTAAGRAAVALIFALKDGLQLDQDTEEMIDFLMKVTGAVDEFKGDTDAAIGHFIAGVGEEFGDRKLDAPAPPV